MPQLGWELYKDKQEVMPSITKGHFPSDWNECFNDPRSAMHPGGGRGRQWLSDKAHNLWSHTLISKVWNTVSDKEQFLCWVQILQNEVCITINLRLNYFVPGRQNVSYFLPKFILEI